MLTREIPTVATTEFSLAHSICHGNTPSNRSISASTTARLSATSNCLPSGSAMTRMLYGTPFNDLNAIGSRSRVQRGCLKISFWPLISASDHAEGKDAAHVIIMSASH